MTTEKNDVGSELLRAAEDLVKSVPAERMGRGSLRYRLAPYRDQLRELLISSPLSIRAIVRLLEGLETPVRVSPTRLGIYLKTEWPEEWEKHANRLNSGSKRKSPTDKKPASTVATEKKINQASPTPAAKKPPLTAGDLRSMTGQIDAENYRTDD